MVKQQDSSNAKTHDCKWVAKPKLRASKITAPQTAYDTSREKLSPFGGFVLALLHERGHSSLDDRIPDEVYYHLPHPFAEAA